MKNLTLLLALLGLLLAPAAPARAQFAAPGGPARVSFRLEVKGKMTAEQQAHIGCLVARTARGDIRMPFGPGAQTFELNLPADTLFPLGADLYRGFAVAAVEINGRKLPRKQLKDLPDGLLTDRLADVATGRGGASVKVTLRTDPSSPARYLAYSPDANGAPYRIPALAATPNGHLLAFFDSRPCGGDIGYGEVDVQWRLSRDGGRSWSPARTLADGQGGESGWQVGFGDAAVAADAESDEVVVMMVCGKTVCWHGNYLPGDPASNPNRVARVRGRFNPALDRWEFTEPEEVTESIYSLFVDGGRPTVQSLFIGSGKMAQSRLDGPGSRRRIYCAVWTKNEGNRVVYSDDFGSTWHILGNVHDRPAPHGDEPKCEELPDGSVLLSSRKAGGRYFNVFRFTDRAAGTGSWDRPVASDEVEGGLRFGRNSTNGEVLLVENAREKATGRPCRVLLQTVPAGEGRSDVSVYYRILREGEALSAETLAKGWQLGRHVSHRGSAYSTLVEQADGRLGLFFEEEPAWYCLVYLPLTLEEATAGACRKAK